MTTQTSESRRQGGRALIGRGWLDRALARGREWIGGPVHGRAPAPGAGRRADGDGMETVRVGSVIRVFDIDALRERVLTLVPPASADASRHRVPVDTGAGAALLGSRPGDSVDWEDASGRRRVRVVGILGYLAELDGVGARPVPAATPVPAPFRREARAA